MLTKAGLVSTPHANFWELTSQRFAGGRILDGFQYSELPGGTAGIVNPISEPLCLARALVAESAEKH
jgi:hypothetical protein